MPVFVWTRGVLSIRSEFCKPPISGKAGQKKRFSSPCSFGGQVGAETVSVRLADRCPISAAAELCTGKAHHGFRSTHAYIHMLCLGPDRYTCGQDVHEKRPGDTEVRRRASPPYSRQWLAKWGTGTPPTQPSAELKLKLSRSGCAP